MGISADQGAMTSVLYHYNNRIIRDGAAILARRSKGADAANARQNNALWRHGSAPARAACFVTCWYIAAFLALIPAKYQLTTKCAHGKLTAGEQRC